MGMMKSADGTPFGVDVERRARSMREWRDAIVL